eukprot:6190055-Pleurochrysis_carterae.AAC.1
MPGDKQEAVASVGSATGALEKEAEMAEKAARADVLEVVAAEVMAAARQDDTERALRSLSTSRRHHARTSCLL